MSEREDEDDRTGVPPEGGYFVEFPEKSTDDVLVVHDADKVWIAPVGTPPPTPGQELGEGWVDIGATVDSFTFAPGAEIRVADHLKDGSGDVRVDEAKVDEDGNLRISGAVIGAVVDHLEGLSIGPMRGPNPNHNPQPFSPTLLPREMHTEFELPAWEGDRRRLINTIVGKIKPEPTFPVPNRADRRRAAKKKGRR